MLNAVELDALLIEAAGLDRAALSRAFATHRGPFAVDLSPEFLASQTLERLRHIYVALRMQSARRPAATVGRSRPRVRRKAATR